MANNAQARKRARQSEVNRKHNASRRSMMRTQVKKVVKSANAGDLEAAVVAYKAAVPVLDNAAGTGLIHRNKAARLKSRLNARLKKMAQASA